MKTRSPAKDDCGLTLIEVLVVLAVVAAILMLAIPALEAAKVRALRLPCVNNLKQTGLAFQVWAGDNHGDFPMAIPQAQGGTMEFITGTNAFRHLQVMSNELSTPTVVACPAEAHYETRATNFTDFNNANISFFIGVDADLTNGPTILAGDRNLTNGTALKDAILEVTSTVPSGWTDEIHKKAGNVVMSDASVRRVSISGLRDIIAKTGLATNRLQMPVLTP